MGAEGFDKIIIGAGLYGLYAALFCSQQGQRVLVLECDDQPFRRATYINQARVHQGYHYPRSLSTALKSAGYFERFNRDYGFCVHREFDQIYVTSSRFSWTDGRQFQCFCQAAGIPCQELSPGDYFQEGACDGAFRTREYTYDAMILRDYFLEKLREQGDRVTLRCGAHIRAIQRNRDSYVISLEDGYACQAGYVLNAAYAGVNQILALAGLEPFGIKYELCEIILCDAEERRILMEYTQAAIRFAEAIGCENLVFGCPRNRAMPERAAPEQAIPFFRALGDYAAAHHCVIALETNPPIYHTNFLNTTQEALAFIQRVDSEGCRLNLDVGTMIENGEEPSLLKGCGPVIHHVHISEPGLKLIERRPLHQELAALLREEGYDRYVSIEMGRQEDMKALARTMAYVRELLLQL